MAKTDEPTSAVTADQLAALIQALPQALAGLALQPSQIKEILEGVAQSTQKAMKPENAVHPAISAYSYPEGDVARPKPVLNRKTFFNGMEEAEERLTPSEIDAYNAIDEPKAIRGGSWRAEIRKSRNVGEKEGLFVWVPASTVDQRMMLPSLLLVLHELNGGPSTENVLDLLKQIQTLKAMLLKAGTFKTAAELETQLLAS